MDSTPAQRIEKLRDEIRRHDHAYYVVAKPTITDQQYDKLFEMLRSLESAHPDLVTEDSPTQRVGGTPTKGFRHVTHATPMLSVDNTYDAQQLRDFDERIAKGLSAQKYSYIVDPKIDGVAVALTYEHGLLVLAATRGDGTTGDNITTNARTVTSIPQCLVGAGVPALLEVRGEIVWPVKEFKRFNAARKKQGETTFANPRNATTGTLKKHDSSKIAGRGLMFIAHGFGRIEPMTAKTDDELFAQLKSWGIPVDPMRTPYESIEKIIDRLDVWDKKRKDFTYETDGLVIKVDDLAQRETLAATSRYPRWCIAYKFAPEHADSVLLSVDYQVGKTGTITPRAVMEERKLSGTMVRHASLHNFDQVERLGLYIGAAVRVQKAGEIIPQVVKLLSTKPEGATPIPRPTQCPVCKGDVEQDEGGVYIRCINPTCPAQLKERLTHFASRNCMDIEGAGAVLIETLVDAGFLHDYADVYHLNERRDELIELGRLGEKSVDNLLAGIEVSKQRPLFRLLAALNIRHVGASTAELLADHFESMPNIVAATEESLTAVDGVGPEMAASIVHFFKSKEGARSVERLEAVGVNMTQPKRPDVASGPFEGLTVVVTGTLETMGREEAKGLIKRLGGKVAPTVSSKTNLLVFGASPGSKLSKAEKLDVEAIDETEFLRRADSAFP